MSRWSRDLASAPRDGTPVWIRGGTQARGPHYVERAFHGHVLAYYTGVGWIGLGPEGGAIHQPAEWQAVEEPK